MNRDKTTLYTLSASYLGVALLGCFVTNFTVRSVFLALFTLLAALAVFLLIKKRSILELPRRQVAVVMAAVAIISLMAYFLTGLRFGFYRVPVSPSFLWQYILPLGLTVISAEIARSIFAAQKDRLVSALCWLSMVLLDVLMLTEGRVTSDYEHFVDGLGLVWLPALSANVLYHYLSGRYGALPNIAYRLIILLYPYVVPFAPQMSDALLAFARIFLPMGILLLIHTLYTPKVFVETMRKRRIQSALTAVFTIAALLFVMLISGQFRYKALVVATQ